MDKTNITITICIEELEELFDILNKNFFDDELERPVLTLNPNTNKQTAYGWCTTKKIWHDLNRNTSHYEITICPEFIDRPLEEIVGTMLHEMVHLYNLHINVKDCSRNSSYHNKRFKTEAECRGLVIEHDKTYGWTKTSLNQEAKDFVKKLNFKLTPIVRGNRQKISFDEDENEEDQDQDQDQGQEKKQKVWKYICPACGCSVRATKIVHIKCMDCDEEMIEEKK